MKAFFIFVLFSALSISGFAQSGQEVIKKQAEQRRNSPDYIDNRKVIANPQQLQQKDNATKKHKCIFHKKKRQKPAAKDVLKDRNTKDPRIDRQLPSVEKAIPLVPKDSSKN
ncbi:MAG: hypothetical protein J7539_13165 [Niabella sp.]|nr:hypothetical protein [Niabella sp.]